MSVKCEPVFRDTSNGPSRDGPSSGQILDMFQHLTMQAIARRTKTTHEDQVVHVPKIVEQKRVQQRTVEQVVDIPIPQVRGVAAARMSCQICKFQHSVGQNPSVRPS